MRPADIPRAVALVALAALATSIPEKIGHAEAEGGVDAGAVSDSGAASDSDASREAGTLGPEAGAGHYQAGDGTVYDTRTKLTWQLDVSMTPVDWATAKDYCGGLDLGGMGWRLPSVSELQTLIDETTTDPAIDLTAFPGTPSDYFWTSSILPRFESFVWTVYFGYGLSTFFDVNQTHFVRCVR